MYNLVVDMASCSAQHVRDPVVTLMRPTSPKQYAAKQQCVGTVPVRACVL